MVKQIYQYCDSVPKVNKATFLLKLLFEDFSKIGIQRNGNGLQGS